MSDRSKVESLSNSLAVLSRMTKFIEIWLDDATQRLASGDVEGAVAACKGLDAVLTEMISVYRERIARAG